jgi:hypothetical protein
MEIVQQEAEALGVGYLRMLVRQSLKGRLQDDKQRRAEALLGFSQAMSQEACDKGYSEILAMSKTARTRVAAKRQNR